VSRIDNPDAVGYFDIACRKLVFKAVYAAGGRRVMTVPESIIMPAVLNTVGEMDRDFPPSLIPVISM